ncbi:MAG: glycosyltransferase family 1 protein [Bacteroidetes bacterium]|nr:MAG: glycosyltransferase family 1 protein [Bacteroidota bacterium]
MSRIGYDAKRLFNNFTGLGNYSRTLLQNLVTYYPEEVYFLYTPKVVKCPETHFFLDSPMFTVRQPQPHQKLFWRSLRVKALLKRDKIELYHGLSHEIPLGMDKLGIPSVVTMHDLIFKHYPEHYGYFDRLVYDFKFRYACKHASGIIAISESTKRDIIHWYDIPQEKIKVIYQSCSDHFMQEKSPETISELLRHYGLPADYLLYVGSLVERKNLLGIVEALALLPTDLQLPLVIVGQGAAYKQKVLRRARQLGVADKLLFVQVAYADLPAVYQQAQVFVYPSYFEGFGIPVIEALYSKTPVVTSNVSSLPEAAGPGSKLVPPADYHAIAAAIQELLTDTSARQQAIEAGWAYVQRFNGQALTEELVDYYKCFL